jgi:hypothetical protein
MKTHLGIAAITALFGTPVLAADMAIEYPLPVIGGNSCDRPHFQRKDL